MTKNEAAEFLGVSLRTLERYGAEKRIQPTIKRTPKGRAADYAESDLIRLKAELSGDVDISSPDVAATIPTDTANPLALSRDSSKRVSPPNIDTTIVPSNRQGAAIVAVTSPPSLPTQDVTTIAFSREVLTIADAVLVSSFPEGRIRAALRDKTLKGALIGRGWRILRSDLDDWCRSLFE